MLLALLYFFDVGYPPLPYVYIYTPEVNETSGQKNFFSPLNNPGTFIKKKIDNLKKTDNIYLKL